MATHLNLLTGGSVARPETIDSQDCEKKTKKAHLVERPSCWICSLPPQKNNIAKSWISFFLYIFLVVFVLLI